MAFWILTATSNRDFDRGFLLIFLRETASEQGGISGEKIWCWKDDEKRWSMDWNRCPILLVKEGADDDRPYPIRGSEVRNEDSLVFEIQLGSQQDPSRQFEAATREARLSLAQILSQQRTFPPPSPLLRILSTSFLTRVLTADTALRTRLSSALVPNPDS